jgi:hypothetical protein
MLAANTAKIMTSAYTVYIGIVALPEPHSSEGVLRLLVGTDQSGKLRQNVMACAAADENGTSKCLT